MARGSFPDSHPLCLGMPGMHGNYTAVTAMQRSDLLIAVGSRFDDRVTGRVDAFAPEAKIIHVDIDPAEHNKVRRADVAVAGDCRLVIDELPGGPGPPRPAPQRNNPGRFGRGPERRRLRCPRHPGDGGRRPSPGPAHPVAGSAERVAASLPPRLRPAARIGGPQAPVRPGGPAGCHPRRHHRGLGGGPAPDVRLAVVAVRLPLLLGSTRGASAPWDSLCPRPSGPRWAGRTRWCGRWTATAASR